MPVTPCSEQIIHGAATFGGNQGPIASPACVTDAAAERAAALEEAQLAAALEEARASPSPSAFPG